MRLPRSHIRSLDGKVGDIYSPSPAWRLCAFASLRYILSRRSLALALLTPITTFALLLSAQTAGLEQLERAFQHPPDDSRIMMRWWWFGPAVTKSELEREMRLMKEGGVGGFEVQPT